ncbi:MAG: hypothetical protein AAGC67_09265 [Myxococcota bacterium]
MILAIEPRPERGLEVTSVLVDAEDRDYVALLDVNTHRSDERLRICSGCKRIDLPDEGWTEIERSLRTLDLFGAPPLPQLHQALCPPCETRTAVG